MNSIEFSHFQYSAIAVVVMASITLFLRFIPFVIFANRTPKILIYLGTVLPYSIMAMLVVYCLKNVNIFDKSRLLPEVISIILIVILHKWKHNTLLSITFGTLCYMYLIQKVFY